MKKVFAILTAFVFVGLVACGPSEADKQAKHIADSTRVADSLAKEDALKKASEMATPVDTSAAVQDTSSHAGHDHQ